jgi:hypothetical protein
VLSTEYLEAAANEYKSFRFTAKQPGGLMGALNQISGSPGTSFSGRSTLFYFETKYTINRLLRNSYR